MKQLTEAICSWPLIYSCSLMILLLAGVSYIIWWACQSFEPAAGFLGRKLPPGVKGATIDATASSMPEYLTTIMFLSFVARGLQSTYAIGAGIALTAGSAMFNGAIIPALSIFAALGWWGRKNGLKEITLAKPAMVRDFGFLLAAELILIVILEFGSIGPWACAILLGFYGIYCLKLYRDAKNAPREDSGEFEGWTAAKAWLTILWTVLVLCGACYILAELVFLSAEILDIHPLVTSMFLGAAASSVPDTILSIQSARKGEYEDAFSNAAGSNTFDICFALAKPMLIFTLFFGTVALPEDASLTLLRFGLLLLTAIVAAILIIPTTIRRWQGWALLGLYSLWTVFALNTEFHWLF